MVSKFVLFGANSDVSKELIKICRLKNYEVIGISRKMIDNFEKHESIIVKDYLEDYEKIVKSLKSYKNITIIFFNGALYENRPLKSPNEEEIFKTKFINFKIPFELCKKLNKDLDNVNKFVFISSMAAVKPRYKNFIYGETKKKLEVSLLELNLNSLLIIRFGKIYTKMSEGHGYAPFSLSPERAAQIIFNKLNKVGLKYANFGLFLVSIIIKLIPSRILMKNQLNL